MEQVGHHPVHESAAIESLYLEIQMSNGINQGPQWLNLFVLG